MRNWLKEGNTWPEQLKPSFKKRKNIYENEQDYIIDLDQHLNAQCSFTNVQHSHVIFKFKLARGSNLAVALIIFK